LHFWRGNVNFSKLYKLETTYVSIGLINSNWPCRRPIEN